MGEQDNMTTEEALREIVKSSGPGPKTLEEYHKQSDRIVDLIIDLIAERSEEKAEEIVDKHVREWEHGHSY